MKNLSMIDFLKTIPEQDRGKVYDWIFKNRIRQFKFYSHQNRLKPTSSEHDLKMAMRLGNIEFKCQIVIEPYIVDFYLPRRNLIVEVDGPYHNLLWQKAHDKKRNEFLEEKGWKVLHFKNAEVEKNTVGCISKILEHEESKKNLRECNARLKAINGNRIISIEEQARFLQFLNIPV